MIIGLLVIIVVFEVIRFVVYIQDSRRIRITNERVSKQQHKISITTGGNKIWNYGNCPNRNGIS